MTGTEESSTGSYFTVICHVINVRLGHKSVEITTFV